MGQGVGWCGALGAFCAAVYGRVSGSTGSGSRVHRRALEVRGLGLFGFRVEGP